MCFNIGTGNTILDVHFTMKLQELLSPRKIIAKILIFIPAIKIH